MNKRKTPIVLLCLLFALCSCGRETPGTDPSADNRSVKETPSAIVEATADTVPKDAETREETVSGLPADVKIAEKAFDFSGPLNIKLLDGRKNIPQYAFYHTGGTLFPSEITLPDSVRTIGRFSFSGSKQTLTVNLNNSLSHIKRAGLSETIIPHLPDSLTVLDGGALCGADIKNIGQWISCPPKNLEKMGRECLSLSNGRFHIPASVTHIELDAIEWEYTAKPLGYDVEEKNAYYKSDENGWLYSKDGRVLYFAYHNTEGDFVIPGGVEYVYKYGIRMYNEDTPEQESAAKIKGTENVKMFESENQIKKVT